MLHTIVLRYDTVQACLALTLHLLFWVAVAILLHPCRHSSKLRSRCIQVYYWFLIRRFQLVFRYRAQAMQ